MNDKEKIEFLTNQLQHIHSLLNWSNPAQWSYAVSEAMQTATEAIKHINSEKQK